MAEAQTSNLVEYTRRADASFAEKPFNEADGLVLSELAYLKWQLLDPALFEDGTMTLRDLVSHFTQEQIRAHFSADEAAMLNALKESDRFGSMTVSNFFSINTTADQVDAHTELEQFAALVFTYTDENGQTQHFVSYRGTDNTLEGWCEDFNMAYDSMTNAQRRAVEYLNDIASRLDGTIRLGGHSKGGNNAMYAFLFCDEAVRQRIIKIHIHDSPGFHRELTYTDPQGNTHSIDPEIYERMKELLKGTAICPYDSVIGLLLDEVEFRFVQTDAGIFADHDGYTWQLDPETGEFCFTEQSELSKYLNELLDEWIVALPEEHRKTVVVTVWSWIYTLNVSGFSELGSAFSADFGGTIASLLSYIGTLPEEEQARFRESFATLAILAADNGLETHLPGYETIREKLAQELAARNIRSVSDLWRYLQADPIVNTMELLESLLADPGVLMALVETTATVAVVQTLLHTLLMVASASIHAIAPLLPAIAAIVAAAVFLSKAIEYIRAHWEELKAFVTMAAEFVQQKIAEFVAAMKLAISAAVQTAVTAVVYSITELVEQCYAAVTGLVDVVEELGRLASAAVQHIFAVSNPLLYAAVRLVTGLRQAAVTIDMSRLQRAVARMDALAVRVQRMDYRLDGLYRLLCIKNIKQGEDLFTSLANLYRLSSADICVDQGSAIRRKANAISDLYAGYTDAEKWALSLLK